MHKRVLPIGLLAVLLIASAAFAAPRDDGKDLVPCVEHAARGFMTHCPEPVEGHPQLRRAAFMCTGLPKPVVQHDQWDWGDCTARAVRDWLFIREMTGDQTVGRDMQKAQSDTLLWLLAPETGMPCVPDKSDPEKNSYHYQMWDQGRTLRALVEWWQRETDLAVKKDLQTRIDRMIQSLREKAKHGEDPEWGSYAVYPFDHLDGGQPGDDIMVVRGGQLLEPLAVYWTATKKPEVRHFAEEIYAGVRSGHEGDTYQGANKKLFIFNEDGSFHGHFHAHVSTALGAVRFGKTLYQQGEKPKALKMLRWAKSVYDWTLADDNVNKGSRWGWFPENVGTDETKAREVSETCCTADMIEFAAALADVAQLDPTLNDWDALWDHVERYTINYMLQARFTVTPEYKRLLADSLGVQAMTRPADRQKLNQNLKTAHRLTGSWVSCVFPNQIVGHNEKGSIFYLGGCCAYSGTRGLYACWKPAFHDDGQILQVRIPIDRKADYATQTVTENAKEVHQRIKLREQRKLQVRIPDWADISKVAVRTREGKEVPFTTAGRRLEFSQQDAGMELHIRYPMRTYTTTEKIGGNGQSILYAPADEKRTFTMTWRGTRVIKIKPEGEEMPLFK